MSKSAEAFRTISEVADWLGTPAHVLRFWESKFSQIKPVKRAGGRRYYRPRDMLLVGGIKKLLHEDGMTIRGAQRLLRDKGISYVSELSQPLTDGLVVDEDAGLSDIPKQSEPISADFNDENTHSQASDRPEPSPEKPQDSHEVAPVESPEDATQQKGESPPVDISDQNEGVASSDLNQPDISTEETSHDAQPADIVAQETQIDSETPTQFSLFADNQKPEQRTLFRSRMARDEDAPRSTHDAQQSTEPEPVQKPKPLPYTRDPSFDIPETSGMSLLSQPLSLQPEHCDEIQTLVTKLERLYDTGPQNTSST